MSVLPITNSTIIVLPLSDISSQSKLKLTNASKLSQHLNSQERVASLE